MRSAVASIVAAGALALGAIPTTLALADEEAAGKAESGRAAGRAGTGPPAWAPAHGHDKTKAGVPDKTEKRRQQARWTEDLTGPPPWAKAPTKADRLARVRAMEQWSACVEAAEAKPTEAEQRAAKSDCKKPTPPGHAR